MLATATERTIDDYPIDAPVEAGPGVWSCPISFPVADDPTFAGRLQAEVALLRPWSSETRAARGRTLFGASGATPDQVDEVVAALAGIADGGNVTDPPASEVEWAFAMPLLVRHLADDLRTFYHEAIAAQPGPGAPSHAALNEWIFGGTALGDTLQAVAGHLTELDSPMAKLVRGLLIPEGFYNGGSAFPKSSDFGN